MIKIWIDKQYISNEYGDIFAPFSLALYAKQQGFIEKSIDCYTTISDIMNIHTAYTGLIAEGEEVICARPTLNRIQTWLRETHGIIVECIYKQFVYEPDNGFYCVIKTKDSYSEHLLENTYNYDYDLSLVSGLESGLDLVII